MSQITVLVVEDNELHAEKIIFCMNELSYKLIDLVDNAQECLELIPKTNPDILLLDINIQGHLNGIELAEIIKKDYDIPIIYTTSLTNRETLQKAIKTQPEAYLNKPIEISALATSIEIAIYKNKNENKVENHKKLILTKVKNLTKQFNLTVREVDLLLFLISGYDNNHIADNLFISVNTVKYHSRNLYEKLNINSRSELTSLFVKLD